MGLGARHVPALVDEMGRGARHGLASLDGGALCVGDGTADGLAVLLNPNDYFSSGVPLLNVTDCLGRLFERIGAVDDRP